MKKVDRMEIAKLVVKISKLENDLAMIQKCGEQAKSWAAPDGLGFPLGRLLAHSDLLGHGLFIMPQ